MRWQPIAVAGLCGAALMSPAGAAPPPSTEAGRFQLQPAEGGFLRLDRETGATAFCAPGAEGYVCRPAADGAAIADDAATRLEKRIAALEDQLRIRAPDAGLPPVPPLPKDDAQARDPTLGLPSREQIDRVAGFFERAMRRLKEIAEDIRKDEAQKDDGQRGERL